MYIPAINQEESGKRLKDLCDEKGYTAKKLQTELGLKTPQACYRWFEGLAIPKINHLVVIAELLGIRIDDLIVTNEVELERDDY